MSDNEHWIVYLITCIAEGDDCGKQYIGQHKRSSLRRWRAHISYAGIGVRYPLYEAIRRYGSDAFTIEEIACCRSRSDALAVEAQTIAAQNTSYPNGFNVKGSTADRNFDPAVKDRRRQTECLRTPEVEAKRLAGLRKKFAEPVFRTRLAERMRAMSDDPVMQQKRRAGIIKANADPVINAKRLTRLRAATRRGRTHTIRDQRQPDLLR